MEPKQQKSEEPDLPEDLKNQIDEAMKAEDEGEKFKDLTGVDPEKVKAEQEELERAMKARVSKTAP
jgi:ABC-type phosphate/phosphonate transport system substrate-binding protein